MINNDNDNSQNQLVRYFCGTSIPAMSMISHEVSWWDMFVVQVSLLCQWYFKKLYFCGRNDTNELSDTANSK